jgi:hypothetical protein
MCCCIFSKWGILKVFSGQISLIRVLIPPRGISPVDKQLTRRFGGPTIVGEWSIADTDCAPYINSIGEGYHLALLVYLIASSTRWEGTYNGAFGTSNPGVPGCALATNCSCTSANAQASAYSAAYKTFLADYFIAQVCFYFVNS